MEIDLNHAVETEVEKNACRCNGECDKGGGCGCACVYCSLSSSTSSCSSNASSSSPSSPSKMFTELWYACAGPVTSLPKKGNVVVYFPQGHLEQASSVSSFPAFEVPTFDIQPQIFCRVLEVELLANKENDDVYTQLTLLPISELQAIRLEGKEHEEDGTDEEGSGAVPIKSTSHMFCKTLTASDTSTHGGFSVPRRAAEDCFPPLDYKEQRPSQELVAKDLHGMEWKFRHIYRGQPRRHLLTTGWSIFVSQKNLVSGDAVLFLRGEGGELRLGIRRATGPRNGLSDSIIKNQHSYPNVLAPVANAVSTNGAFQQGNTMGTYGQLIQALDMDHRAKEAHEFWMKKIGSDLHAVPWKLCKLMISVYYRNNMLQDLVKLFKGLEAFDRKPPEKSIVQKVANAYEMLGLVEEKERVTEKYKELFVETWRGRPKNSNSPRSEKKKKKNLGTRAEKESDDQDSPSGVPETGL